MSVLQKISWLEPSTVLDVGANVGSWAKEAHAVWPHAQITMVEANGKCEPMLREAGFPYVIAALGKEPGQGTFYKQPGADTGTGNSFYRELTPFFDNPDTEELEITTLDELFPDQSWDLVKLDTQGSECDILMGARHAVSKAKGLLLEVGFERYNEGAPLSDFVVAFIHALGFKNEQEIENIVHPIGRHRIQANILFTR